MAAIDGARGADQRSCVRIGDVARLEGGLAHGPGLGPDEVEIVMPGGGILAEPAVVDAVVDRRGAPDRRAPISNICEEPGQGWP